jgi:hypothetical protein
VRTAFRVVSLGADGPQGVLVTRKPDTFRYDDIWTLDLRLGRAVSLGGRSAAQAIDLLNAFDSRTVVARNDNVGSSAFGEVTRTLTRGPCASLCESASDRAAIMRGSQEVR